MTAGQVMAKMPADTSTPVDPPAPGLRGYWPGVLVALLATLAAAYLSEHYGAPLTLMALLFGLALNFLSVDTRLVPGLGWASRTPLRIGIVLIGLRVTLGQIADLGAAALCTVILIVAATLGVGVVVSRRLKLGSAFGVLAGGAVAICGASAAMALAATMGPRRIKQADLALVLVGISAMSALAMFLYPIIAHHLGLTDKAAGFMLGAAIHDVAQALGAGYTFSQPAGEAAAIVKLTRVALLAPLLGLLAIRMPSHGETQPAITRLPWFVVGFFALVIVNSTGIVSAQVSGLAQQASTWLLALAIAATGVRSPMASLLEGGMRPMLVIVASTVTALMLAVLAAWFLI